jgi:hypothetical protein
VKHELVQDAGRLMGAPARIEIRAVLEQEVRDIEVTVDHRPRERLVEHVLDGEG